MMSQSQAYLAFKAITLGDIEKLSLQEALRKDGLSQGMSQQQLQDCRWKVHFLQNRIETLRLQKQNETLRALQEIAKLQESNQKLQERIIEGEKTIAQRERAIAQREQATTRREQATTRREQAIAQREQAIAQREQAIRLQEAPFYLKGQFLVGYGLCLLGIGVSLALGWKGQTEPGYNGLLAGVVIGGVFTLVWILLLIWKGCIAWKA